MQLSREQIQRLSGAPVGRLSTASKAGAPHVIPVCFALDSGDDGAAIYIVLDGKPKRVALTRLRRVRNILENPQVALVVDHYEADWTRLWYTLVTGAAELLADEEDLGQDQAQEDGAYILAAHSGPAAEHRPNDERSHAIRLLREKYPQYREMDIDENPVIKITPRRVVAWSYTPES